MAPVTFLGYRAHWIATARSSIRLGRRLGHFRKEAKRVGPFVTRLRRYRRSILKRIDRLARLEERIVVARRYVLAGERRILNANFGDVTQACRFGRLLLLRPPEPQQVQATFRLSRRLALFVGVRGRRLRFAAVRGRSLAGRQRLRLTVQRSAASVFVVLIVPIDGRFARIGAGRRVAEYVAAVALVGRRPLGDRLAAIGRGMAGRRCCMGLVCGA